MLSQPSLIFGDTLVQTHGVMIYGYNVEEAGFCRNVHYVDAILSTSQGTSIELPIDLNWTVALGDYTLNADTIAGTKGFVAKRKRHHYGSD